jgi:serine/threonine-protein kinase
MLARLYSYKGRFDDAARMLSEYEENVGPQHPGLVITTTRIAMLQNDLVTLERMIETMENAKNVLTPMARFFRLALGQIDKDEAAAIEVENRQKFVNARFQLAIGQVATETFSFAGHPALALRTLGALAEDIFVDVVWMDRCRLLDPLRGDPIFAEAAAKTRHRAAATWLP